MDFVIGNHITLHYNNKQMQDTLLAEYDVGNYSAIYINEKLLKVKEIHVTCALTTSVI